LKGVKLNDSQLVNIMKNDFWKGTSGLFLRKGMPKAVKKQFDAADLFSLK
jgi:hypothetical protein